MTEIAVNHSDDSDAFEASDDESHVEDEGEAVLTLVDDESSALVLPKQAVSEEIGENDSDFCSDVVKNDVVKNITEKEPKVSLQPESPSLATLRIKKRRRRKRALCVCTSHCKYECIRRMTKLFGFREVTEDDDWQLFWTDSSVSLERVMDMKRYQKINHFPGMSEICRKDLLSRNMNRMYKIYPKEYNVFPKSWCLPADYADFMNYAREKKKRAYILKPETGCQGRGISIVTSLKDIKAHERIICQQYISKPLLIDNMKFDLRLYVLVTSCDPLRLFVFQDGLARFATKKYNEPTSKNSNDVYMHLTNYSINKSSKDFVRDDDCGSKRRISTVLKYMENKGYDVKKLLADIDDVIIKVMISAHSILKHNYRTCFPNHVQGSACFEILGFDILLDKKLKPYLLEVNHSPSFHTDHKLDKEVKEALIYDTLALVNFRSLDRKKYIEEEKRKIRDRLFQRADKKQIKEELEAMREEYFGNLGTYEELHMGNFRRIYPSNTNIDKYEKYFHSSGSLFQETAAFKARQECARQQREEILKKQELAKSHGQSRSDLGESSKKKLRRRKNEVSKPPRSSRLYPQRPRSLDILKTRDKSQLSPTNGNEPGEIVDEEELQRISGLLQRDNLVKGLGIVEYVYKMFHMMNNQSARTRDKREIYKLSGDNGFNNSIFVAKSAHTNQLHLWDISTSDTNISQNEAINTGDSPLTYQKMARPQERYKLSSISQPQFDIFSGNLSNSMTPVYNHPFSYDKANKSTNSSNIHHNSHNNSSLTPSTSHKILHPNPKNFSQQRHSVNANNGTSFIRGNSIFLNNNFVPSFKKSSTKPANVPIPMQYHHRGQHQQNSSYVIHNMLPDSETNQLTNRVKNLNISYSSCKNNSPKALNQQQLSAPFATSMLSYNNIKNSHHSIYGINVNHLPGSRVQSGSHKNVRANLISPEM